MSKKLLSIVSVIVVSVFGITLSSCGDNSSDSAITVISREDGSGTRSAFIELFGVQNSEKEDMTIDDAQITNNTAVMLSSVAGDKNSIGYVSLGSLSDTVKPVGVDGIAPNEQNIKSGAYKIKRPFNIVTKGIIPDTSAAREFMCYISSDAGQKIVSNNGYIAIDKTKKVDDCKQYANKQDGSAVIKVGGSSSVSPLMEKLQEGYQKWNTNKNTVEIQTSDSTTGINSTISGSFEIGMASRELKDTEEAQGLQAMQIATDGLAVIVNKENSVNNLKSEDVKAIYTGSKSSWSDIK